MRDEEYVFTLLLCVAIGVLAYILGAFVLPHLSL